MNAEISVSVPTDDEADDDPVIEEVRDDISVVMLMVVCLVDLWLSLGCL
jgi:hypothetical protein